MASPAEKSGGNSREALRDTTVDLLRRVIEVHSEPLYGDETKRDITGRRRVLVQEHGGQIAAALYNEDAREDQASIIDPEIINHVGLPYGHVELEAGAVFVLGHSTTATIYVGDKGIAASVQFRQDPESPASETAFASFDLASYIGLADPWTRAFMRYLLKENQGVEELPRVTYDDAQITKLNMALNDHLDE